MTIEQGESFSPDQGENTGSEGGSGSFDHGNAEPEEAEQSEAPEGHQAYEPNFKFKYYDQEGEFDEWARQFVKDKETEDRFRGLYAKSNGFDVLRDKFKAKTGEYGELETKYKDIETKYTSLDQEIDEVIWQRDNDLHGFFESWNVPVDRVIDFVEQYLDKLGLPPDQQKKLDDQRAVLAEKRQLEKQVQQFSSEKQQQSQQAHVEEFESLIEHPEVAGFAAEYDARVGSEGSFAQAVIQHGDTHFHRTGESLSPIDAIRAVYKQYKPFVRGDAGAKPAPQAGASAEQSREPAPQHQRPKPVPSLGGASTASPTKKVYKSLDDLKKHLKSVQDED